MTISAAIIPARGGSVRIPQKNHRLFHGKPICWYPIKTAYKSGLFDRIIVSTDSKAIAEIAEMTGAEVWWRPKDDGSRGTQEVTIEVLKANPGIVIACCIYPTAALLTTYDLARGRAALKKQFLYSMSVETDPLADAGQFYWGFSSSFLFNVPLIDMHTAMIPVEGTVDINVEEDWLRAEQLYALREAK